MEVLKVAILAVIGALIGWLTNIIAIKLIFRPLKPVKLPLFNVSIQGLIPKRREEIAKSIGKVIEDELLSIKEIINKVIDNEDFTQVKFVIKGKINEVIGEKLPPIIPSVFKNMIYNYVNELVDQDGDRIIKELVEKMANKAVSEISLSQIVEEKINTFELDKIESIIIAIANRELKHIEILGGVLGFLIGIFQGIIILLF